MTTDSNTAARDLQVGDAINGARVNRVDTRATPGLVYVWINGNTAARADMIFHHADRVRIVRDEQVTLEAGLDAAERAANGPGASGILYR